MSAWKIQHQFFLLFVALAVGDRTGGRSVVPFVNALSPSSTTKAIVRVCQNKDCCRNFQQGKSPSSRMDLVQTLQLLQPPPIGKQRRVQIEASPCLSQCDKGPNMEVELTTAGGGPILCHQITDAATAAVQLDALLSGSPTPPLLLAAVKVLNSAMAATSSLDKLKFLNSVITRLESNSELCNSAAIAHAYAMRADYYCSVNDWDSADMDARRVLDKNSKLFPIATLQTKRIVYRSLADAMERRGSLAGAIATLSEWAKHDPQYRTKLNYEMQKIRQRGT